jgi:hypothetical protein
MTKQLVIIKIIFILSYSALAQKPSDYLPEKPGKWSYLNNVTSTEAEYIAFKKTMASLAEWFHQNVPMLTNPKGYDLLATTYGQFDKYYKMDKSNYGLRDEMHFSFQLFYSNGGKWTIEPPAYSFEINNTETGHPQNNKVAWFDETKDDPALEKAINAAAVKMNGVFPVFEFVKQITPGVDLYREAENAYPHHVVVYDPNRPLYWLPVTVKELADLYLEYYSLYQKLEIDQLLLQELKTEIANIPPEELNARAYMGHESNIVFRINGREDGLIGTEKGFPLMRFNPEYWDRTRPISEIQFMTFYYPQMTDAQMDESYKNNGHPYYPQLLVTQFDWSKIAGLIKKGK